MHPAAPSEHRLAVIGHGVVGWALRQLLEATRRELAERHGVAYRITLVATRRAGVLIAEGGVSAEDVRTRLTGAPPAPQDGAAFVDHLAAVLAEPATPYDVLVELSAAAPRDGQPAARYLAAALGSGRDAVTANKAPVAWHADELGRLAAASGSRLRCEAAVMDCLPVLAIRTAMLPVGPITGFAGIVNSTTNAILTAMTAGEAAADALGEAQRAGIAEADPEHDLSGHDAALKATILANLLFEPRTPITPAAVSRRGIADIDPDWPARAGAAGKRVKLVARGAAGEHGAQPRVRVQPEELALGHPLARVDGTSMALQIESALGGRLDLVSTTPGVEHTAYAVLMDLLALRRPVTSNRPSPA